MRCLETGPYYPARYASGRPRRPLCLRAHGVACGQLVARERERPRAQQHQLRDHTFRPHRRRACAQRRTGCCRLRRVPARAGLARGAAGAGGAGGGRARAGHRSRRLGSAPGGAGVHRRCGHAALAGALVRGAAAAAPGRISPACRRRDAARRRHGAARVGAALGRGFERSRWRLACGRRGAVRRRLRCAAVGLARTAREDLAPGERECPAG